MHRKLVMLSLFGVSAWYGITSSPAQQEFAKSTCKAVSQRKAHNVHPNEIQSKLTPQECSKHIGEFVSVRFLVDNTHACRKGHVYLNESKDYKKCFAAIISAPSLVQADIVSQALFHLRRRTPYNPQETVPSIAEDHTSSGAKAEKSGSLVQQIYSAVENPEPGISSPG